jgi:hypothetical protein
MDSFVERIPRGEKRKFLNKKYESKFKSLKVKKDTQTYFQVRRMNDTKENKCSKCGAILFKNDIQEIKNHDKYCAIRALRLYDHDTGKFIRIPIFDNNNLPHQSFQFFKVPSQEFAKDPIKSLLILVTNELGSPNDYNENRSISCYICVTRDNLIVGCLINEVV